MKLKVIYIGKVTTEIEVDDKFAETFPAWERGDNDTYEKLTDELVEIINPQIDGDLSQIFDSSSGELICEL